MKLTNKTGSFENWKKKKEIKVLLRLRRVRSKTVFQQLNFENTKTNVKVWNAPLNL